MNSVSLAICLASFFGPSFIFLFFHNFFNRPIIDIYIFLPSILGAAMVRYNLAHDLGRIAHFQYLQLLACIVHACSSPGPAKLMRSRHLDLRWREPTTRCPALEETPGHTIEYTTISYRCALGLKVVAPRSIGDHCHIIVHRFSSD